MDREWTQQAQDLIFELDIGTRSVIGVVGRPEDGLFHVLATEREEHSKRAMLDGQIEDIAQVALVAVKAAPSTPALTPLREANGSVSRMVPLTMTARKLSAMTVAGLCVRFSFGRGAEP